METIVGASIQAVVVALVALITGMCTLALFVIRMHYRIKTLEARLITYDAHITEGREVHEDIVKIRIVQILIAQNLGIDISEIMDV